jgi:hypothetical protein
MDCLTGVLRSVLHGYKTRPKRCVVLRLINSAVRQTLRLPPIWGRLSLKAPQEQKGKEGKRGEKVRYDD